MNYKRQRKLFFKEISIFFICFFSFVSCTSFNLSSYKIETLLNQANEFASSSNFNDAIITYDKILDIDATNQKALYNKAIVLIELEQYNQALSSINESIENDFNNIENYKLKINVYKELNNINGCIKTYLNLFNIYPYLYEERYNFNKYLISVFDINNTLIKSNLYENSLFLLKEKHKITSALKGLNLLDKNNLEISSILYIYDKKIWEEINLPK